MCGIAGYITRETIEKLPLKKMTDVIAHRGPDGEGHYYGDGFAFGHRRLAIVDLSEHGKQPMFYQDRYVITFNGEIYNHIELKKDLIEEGYQFNNDTDTEVIMAAYDCWGTNCLARFNGMWAFVIYDKKEEIFFISRDRFGKKPF
ncbi:MAG: asparagine synthetase B family protein, partial [Enterovibrio sp.]